jgi:Abi-like protein
MKFRDFRQYFSSARVNRYLTATANSSKRAVKLYKANLKVSQSFHPILGVLEVVLRNRINDILTSHFTDPDWIINQKTGFMVDPSLTYIHKRSGQQKTNDFLLREVKKAEKRLRNSGTPITSGKVIAEQTLGFWTDLFEAHNYRILRGKQIQIFNHLPTGHGRKEVNEELDKVRRFRNRINHNEPICFNGNNIDFSQALEVYQSIKNTLSWIDPELVKLINDIDKVNSSINKALRI